MASDIVAGLLLEKTLSGRVTLVKEMNGSDSSFLVSSVIGHSIRNKIGLIIISTHHPLSHYQNVGLKMMYNMQKHIESGLVTYYDLGEYYVTAIGRDHSKSLLQISHEINQLIETKQQNYDQVTVVVDGLSHLFDLRYSLTDVNNFCKHIINAVRSHINSFVMCVCNLGTEKDDPHLMANYISNCSHTVLEVESLPTGMSADVSGQLTVKHPGRKFQDDDGNDKYRYIDDQPTRYLFKLFDRGVKLFAPGSV